MPIVDRGGSRELGDQQVGLLYWIDPSTSPQISVCRLRFCWDFAAQDFPDAAGRIDFFQLVVTSFCIECPVGSLALAAVPRHPDPGFLEPKSRECYGQELIEYMAAGIY